MIIAGDQLGGGPSSSPCCPRCTDVPLRPWGHARARQLRQRDGSRLLLRPRRLRCPACGTTHVLLPTVAAPRRADTVDVIGAALLAKARGIGHRRIAAELGRPPATVRGWIRRATRAADAIRDRAIKITARLGPDPHPPTLASAGSPLGEAIEELGSAVAAVARRFGPVAQPWHLAALISAGLLPPPQRSRPG